MNIDEQLVPIKRRVDKSQIPTCNILGVDIAAVNMNWLLKYLEKNIKSNEGNLLAGDYICVSNVHTTIISFENSEYCKIQNSGLMAIPDGGPLSTVGRKRGFQAMSRITGPSLMGEIFEVSEINGYRHFFYGSTNETLEKMQIEITKKYNNIEISGMYSPPFRPLTAEEDVEVVKRINESEADFIWIGLGAPKQELWMAEHQGKLSGLMFGVGAGFDFFAGNIKRAPEWMQKYNLEWFYRLLQEPRRLVSRYFSTNTKFIWNVIVRGR